MKRTISNTIQLSLPLLAALSFGCSDDPLVPTPTDAGTHPDAGTPPADGGTFEEMLSVDCFGRFTPGPARTVLSGSNVVLIGHEPALLDVESIGIDYLDGTINGGLMLLDPATGRTRLYTDRDGLPELAGLPEDEHAPAPIYDLTWIQRDRSFAAAAWAHVVRGDFDVEGNLAFTSQTLRAPGATADAFIASIVYVGNELVAGTDQGYVRLAADSLNVLGWIADRDLPWTRGAAAVELEGAAVLGLTGPLDGPGATDVVWTRPGAAEVTVIAKPTPSHRPTAVGALAGRPIVGFEAADGRGELWEVAVTIEGALELVPLMDADRLAAASNERFVPARFAWDATHHELLVGGSITIFGPVRTGGLAVIPAGESGEIDERTRARSLFDRRDPYTQLLPWQVGLLHADDEGRVYVGGVSLCSERRARVTGALRVERDGDELRLVRPIVTGVRSMTEGPDGALWLGLRDEHPALACEGAEVKQHICRLRADGACEIYTPFVNTESEIMPTSIGAAAIAFGNASRQEMAVATLRDATYLRVGGVTRALSTQLDPGLNLEMTDASWGEDGGLWLGSSYEWGNIPGFTMEELLAIHLRGPQGLGFIELDPARGSVTALRRYVRSPSDLVRPHEEIGGLPSSNVRAVIALPGTRRALVGGAPERLGHSYDHMVGAPGPTNAPGGLAIIEDREVRIVAAPAGLDFIEVVDLVASAGTYLALDAVHGVFEVDVTAATATRVAAAQWTGAEAALSLSVGSNGRIAVGTTGGLFVADEAGVLQRVELGNTGWTWSLAHRTGDVLYAGTDAGLCRVVARGSTPPPMGPTGIFARQPWPLDQGCFGERGCACYSNDSCAPQLDCFCASPSNCTCESVVDPCEASPGAAGCDCSPKGDNCDEGLFCHCQGEACTCRAESQECVLDCSCPTPSGCPDGMVCQGGVVGFSCV